MEREKENKCAEHNLMALIIYFTLFLFLIIEKLKAFRNEENRLSSPLGLHPS